MTTIEQTETFADRLVGILNDGCTALMLSIGHQTGLLDALAETGPATSHQVADAAGLDERYVRECLNALSAAAIVEYDATGRRYRLPPDRAAWLTRAAGADNLARMMTLLPMLAEVEQGIVECFRNGGGLPYSAYPRFHSLMAEDSRALMDAALLEQIVPLVDGLAERLAAGIDVCDIGCGSGHAVNLLAQAFPRSRFTGFDFSAQPIDVARTEARELGLDNARFEVLDVATLADVAAYDFVTAFDAIHDQARPADVLANVARALRSDGVFLMVDIRAASDIADNLDHPGAPFLYTVSTMHCMSVSLGLDGAGLGTMWGEQLATEMLHDAGFREVVIRQLPHDPFNDFYVCRPRGV
jgi:SAM-dependent methyltransferase